MKTFKIKVEAISEGQIKHYEDETTTAKNADEALEAFIIDDIDTCKKNGYEVERYGNTIDLYDEDKEHYIETWRFTVIK